jgi:N-acetylneuraminic acid mutarotase
MASKLLSPFGLLPMLACAGEGSFEDAPPASAAPESMTSPAPPPGESAIPDLPGAPVQQPLPELPSVRQEHAVVALGDEIFVIGGFTPDVTASVEAFQPEAGTWRSVAPFPLSLHHANAAEVDGHILVAGFYQGASFTNALGRVFDYDPAADAWSERGVMPAGTERASSCVATLDGKIYLFGGARATTVADSSVYDVAADSWQELPPLPEPREHCLAAAIGGTLYIASGRASGITGFQPNTWAFDPIASTYTRRAAIPTPRGGTAGAVLAGRLYVFGGEGNSADSSGVFPDVEAYDPLTDSWQTLPSMLEPRHGLGAAALADRIYLPGGADTQGFGAAGAHTVLFFEGPAQ